MQLRNRITLGLARQRERQLERATAMIGACFAIVALSFVLYLSAVAVFPLRLPSSLLVILVAAGAVAGTAALLRFSLMRRPDRNESWSKALWLGNLSASVMVMVQPGLILLAAVPVFSGAMILRRDAPLEGSAFIVFPFLVFGATAVFGSLGWNLFT